MAGFLREGLRDEEVNKIVRKMRTLCAEGVGPEEAWLASTQFLVGVNMSSLDAWKKEIFDRVKEAGPLDPTASRTNIYSRTAELAEELSAARRKLAEMASKLEHYSKLGEDVVSKIQYDQLVEDAKARLAAKDEQIKQLSEQLAEAEELLKTPKKK